MSDAAPVPPHCLFRREGDRFVPTDGAPGPWSPNALHGGSVCGLLARSVELAVSDRALFPMRLTVDLFRSVPRAPLAIETRCVRNGQRIQVVDASLLHDGTEVARASSLFLRRVETGELNSPFALPALAGPEGIETSSLLRGVSRPAVPAGLHTLIEVRWTTEPGPRPQAAWFRLPADLVEGEAPSPLVRTAVVGDFANAVASFSMRRSQGMVGPTFINTDTTLYLSRLPVGEWIGMAVDYGIEDCGVGLIEVALYDTEGRFGRTLQARLANRFDASRPAAGRS